MMETPCPAACALANARRCKETCRQRTSSTRGKPFRSVDVLEAPPSKRAKTTPDRPNTISFATTPAHPKRTFNDPLPTHLQPAKRARLSRPLKRDESQDESHLSPTESERLDVVPHRCTSFSPSLASLAAHEALTSTDVMTERYVDDIEAEVEVRLARNEKRRRERLGQGDAWDEVKGSAKRKRVSGDSMSSIESRDETAEASMIRQRGRKRQRKRSGHADDGAMSTTEGKGNTPTNPKRNATPVNHGKRQISAILDGTDERSQDFETMNSEKRRRRKRIALAAS